jgi:hypothetical protein
MKVCGGSMMRTEPREVENILMDIHDESYCRGYGMRMQLRWRN